MRKLIVGCMVGLFLSGAAAEEPLREILEYLEEHAFTVQIEARLLDGNGKAVWNAESSWLTIVGRAVRVPLVDERNQVRIVANITPMRTEDGELMLIAYGELWSPDDGKTRFAYQSFVQSLMVQLGERVILIPGVAIDTRENSYRIELEIQLLPYAQDTADAKSKANAN